MKLLKQALAVLGSVVVIALIAALVTPKTAQAVVAALVEVANTPDNPVPVRDTRVTTSTSATIQAGSNSAQVFPVLPTCPNGTAFLITAVNVAPDFFGNADILALPAWGVRVNVAQQSNGGAGSRPILLYGNGAQHLSVTLPAGQPSFFDVIVQILNGSAPAQFTFIIHISGYCGTAFTTP